MQKCPGPKVDLRNNQFALHVLRIHNLPCTCFEALDQTTCYKGMKLLLEVSKAISTAHSSMALHVTVTFCILIAGLTANSQVDRFLNPTLQAAAYLM